MENPIDSLLILPVLLYFVWQEFRRAKYIKGWLMITLAVLSVFCLTALVSCSVLVGGTWLDNYPVWTIIGILLFALPHQVYEYKLSKLNAPGIYSKKSDRKYNFENFIGYVILMLAILVYYIKS